MNGDLARRTDVPSPLTDKLRMAAELAKSSLIPGHLRQRPENVFIVLMGAEALGIPVFWALQSLHVVDGKLGMDAHLMRGLVVGNGHRFRVVERSNESATVEIRRKDLREGEEPYRATFTIEDAQRAGLTNKNNWRQYTASMLVARATGIAVRDECPELLFGIIYTPDELGAVTDEHGAVVDGEVVPDKPKPAEENLTRARRLAGELSTGVEWFELGGWWRANNPDSIADLVLGGSPTEPVPLTLRQVYAGRLALTAVQAKSREGVRELWLWANEAKCLDHVVSNFLQEGHRDLLRVVLNEAARQLPDREPEQDATVDVTMNDGTVATKGTGLVSDAGWMSVDEALKTAEDAVETAITNLAKAGFVAEVIEVIEEQIAEKGGADE